MSFFNYDQAFSRNIGWVTHWEQQILRHKKVAIAGMGGVGGIHLLTLARLGVQHFHIADLDCFELANFNRQAGAMMSSLGQEKVNVLTQMAKDINPDVDIKVFAQGVTKDNLGDFLEGVDLYVDGLDAFVLEERSLVFARCHAQGIPAITAGPLGMSTAYLVFMPGQMSFEEYFGLQNKPFERQAGNFLSGLNPQMTSLRYLVDRSTFSLKEKRGPSTPMACQLAAGVMGTEAVKIFLNRGQIFAAPWYHAFDPYENKWVLEKLPGGHRNILQKIRTEIIYRVFSSKREEADPYQNSVAESAGDIERILDYARWAPSGDNSQPWRFSIKDNGLLEIDITDVKSIYNFNNYPLWQMAGFLIETIKIAASAFNYEIKWELVRSDKWGQINVRFIKNNTPQDPLFGFIKVRSVNRGCYQKKPLSQKQKEILEQSLGQNVNIQWLDAPAMRREMVQISAMSTDVRLRIKETFGTHQEILEFNRKFSPNKLPVTTINASVMTQKIMKWAMQDWSRIDFLNTFLAGTLLPQLEMDILPGNNCAGFFIVSFKNLPVAEGMIPSLVSTGQSMQRFWLQLTKEGMVMQPFYSPLVFSWYARHNVAFTQNQKMLQKAGIIANRLERFSPIDNIVFIGRIGFPKNHIITSRSVRRPLSELLST